MLEIYLAKWENQGVWLRLPYTKEDLEQAKTRLDEMEPGFPEIYLGNVKSSVPGMTDFVQWSWRNRYHELPYCQKH